MYKKFQKYISPEERRKWLIIQAKEDIKKYLWILKFNNGQLDFYNNLNNEIYWNKRNKILQLIIENIEFYKLLKNTQKLLKNLEKPKKVIKKEVQKVNIHIDYESDNYDNLASDRAREEFVNKGWENHLFNFSR